MPTISDIDKQIAALEAQKQKIIDDEKKAALKKVEDALAELNALGFNYKLTGGASPLGKRRAGVRQSVLEVVKKANGIRPADIAATLDMGDKSGKQSVANALAALKKAKLVSAKDGIYRAT